MISIPDHPQLIQELSYPLHYRGENGRIRIESKADLKRRGLKSPDFAEALVLSEAATVVKKKEFFIR
jgi:phage terminase large subunit